MTQHRECCCGDDAEIECVHSDKVFRHIEDENWSLEQRRLRKSYWNTNLASVRFGAPAANSSTPNIHQTPSSVINYVRTNPAQVEITRPGHNLKYDNSSGMSCMLCQHALVMNFKRKEFLNSNFGFKDCSGGGDDECDPDDGSTDCNQFRYYNWSDDAGYDEEESMSSLYLHWKDYWYLERGPVGIPYSFFDEGNSFSHGTDTQNRFGVGHVNRPGNVQCNRVTPQLTDANYLCYPELGRVCNPINPYFVGIDGLDPNHRNSTGTNKTHLLNAAERAAERTDDDSLPSPPPHMNVYNALDSNFNHVQEVLTQGFSSWQSYLMTANPQLRTMADVISYGDGQKFFRAPIEENSNASDTTVDDNTQYSNLYGSMIGTLYRVRLWVRADKFYLRNGDDIRYPCTTGFGEETGNNTELGPCCINGGRCIDNITQTECEQGYGGIWHPSDYDDGNNLCSVSTDDGNDCFNCYNWSNEHDCSGCTAATGDELEEYKNRNSCSDSEAGPSPNGNIVAFYPPKTNERMYKSAENGGYTPCQKQHAGPWGMVYFCSGAPVFMEDLRQLQLDPSVLWEQGDTIELLNYYNWTKPEDEPEEPQTIEEYECSRIGPIVEKLGDTSKFNSKDWREDQLQKLSNIETGFSQATDTDIPSEFSTYEFSDSIKDMIKSKELLPVQKTSPYFMLSLINQQIADDVPNDISPLSPFSSFRLSGEMPNYQVSDLTLQEGLPPDWKILEYDPWSPYFNEDLTGNGAKLGTDRPYLEIDLPWEDEPFQFRYPIQELYDRFNIEVTIPQWEIDLFEFWWKNIPVYFHSTPGGWSWSGTGDGAVANNLECNWGNSPGGLFNLNGIDSIYQLDLNTYTGNCAPEATGDRCCSTCGLEGCAVPPLVPFPNATYTESVGADGALLRLPRIDIQPRDKPSRLRCRVMNAVCAGCHGPQHGFRQCVDEEGPDGTCCPQTYHGCVPMHPSLAVNVDCDEECGDCYPTCYRMRTLKNCCREFSNPYSSEPYTKFADAINASQKTILEGNPTQQEINIFLENYGSEQNRSINTEREFVSINDNFVATEFDSQSEELQGGGDAPCSVGADCSGLNNDVCGRCPCCCREVTNVPGDPPGTTETICECKQNCDENDDVACDCDSIFNSPHCNYNGACCVSDGKGGQICHGDVSEEQCITPTLFCAHGFGGEWFEGKSCADEPTEGFCGTGVPDTGACCYEDNSGGRTCIDSVTENNCPPSDGSNGVWNIDKTCDELQGDTDCFDDPNPCNGDKGAQFPCCFSDGTCFPASVACCLYQGGTVLGTDDCDSCSTVAIGHCCIEDTSGIECRDDFTLTACQEAQGTFGSGNCDMSSCSSTTDDIGCAVNPGVQRGCLDPAQYMEHVATKWRPVVDPTATGGGKCRVGTHDMLQSCVITHFQSSKHAFRIASFVTHQDPQQSSHECPLEIRGGFGNQDQGEISKDNCCCTGICAAVKSRTLCTGELSPGVVLHQRSQEFTINVYPFRIRCEQIEDINGYQRCGLLQEEHHPKNEDFPAVLIGMADVLSCSYLSMQAIGGGVRTVESHCCSNTSTCELQGGGDVSCNSTNNPSDCVDIFVVECDEDTPNCVRRDSRPTTDENIINKGSHCTDLSSNSLFTANSLRIPGSAGELYTPIEGVLGVPRATCPHSTLTRMEELDRPDILPPDSILGKCAQFYNNKELGNMDNGELFEPPPVSTQLTFTDFGGEISYVDSVPVKEFVDSPPGWIPDSFWIKQQYPDLERIRIFGAGDFNVPRGFEGGRGLSGSFAGSMVLIFGTTTGMAQYDSNRGHENIKIKFKNSYNGAEPYPTSILDCEFIGRPSFNPAWVDPNHDEEIGGWIGGNGLTYANVGTGTGDWVGKVYEFCSNTPDDASICNIKPSAGDSVGNGIRGPALLFDYEDYPVNSLIVDIFRLPGRGTTNQNFIGCP